MFARQQGIRGQNTFVARLLAQDQEANEAARQTLARWERGQFIGIRETRAAAVRRLERQSAGRFSAVAGVRA